MKPESLRLLCDGHTPSTSTNVTVLLHYLNNINHCTITNISPINVTFRGHHHNHKNYLRMLHQCNLSEPSCMILWCWHSWEFTIYYSTSLSSSTFFFFWFCDKPQTRNIRLSTKDTFVMHAYIFSQATLPRKKKYMYMCFSHAASHEPTSLWHARKEWDQGEKGKGRS